MADLKTIPVAIAVVVAALGGGAATVEIVASEGVDRIIADEVVPAADVQRTLDILSFENGDELARLKNYLLPLAEKVKKNEKIDVLKLDEFYALLSFGANIEVQIEGGEDFNSAVRRYLFTRVSE